MLAKATRNLLMIGLFVGGLLAPGRAIAVMVNEPAPDFTLPSTTGKDITLSQFRGDKVAKIIKGAKPADIPVEVNSKIEFAINRKVAQALGLTIAPEVLFQADRLIR